MRYRAAADFSMTNTATHFVLNRHTFLADFKFIQYLALHSKDPLLYMMRTELGSSLLWALKMPHIEQYIDVASVTLLGALQADYFTKRRVHRTKMG